ncbi:ATP-dependent helicase [Lachnobacterium bovis]|uniref:DNA 3'-5' helicase n=1 Tax=Lachnobacterium bovis TaxID=140626 RepID=A0A1H9Q7Y0_9FIRM|nr:ATP-dependent helicase [Lachnobacterium bovis]SER56508.1 DNA helicase-2 / ATP-dependent DNA helicase PcrA [Lachnobacterium bovis]
MKENASQQKAILHKDGPMLVLAGPGSGKTTVITQRTKKLVTDYGIDPSKILVITFTKAAALEMKARFQKLMGDVVANVTFGTFHAVYFTILKYAYHYRASNIITEEERYNVMKRIISNYNSLEYDDINEFIKDIYSEIGEIKNSRLDVNHYYSKICGEEIFREIFSTYQNILQTNKKIDFDDMLSITFELLDQRKDILAAWQSKYQYILVDEFQDINQIQYDILKMLALPENNLFIVGDDDQSIYRFRGSKPEIMLNFPKEFNNSKRVLLDTNYRCQKAIVDASLNLISYNKERFQKKIFAHNAETTKVNYAIYENQADESKNIINIINDYIKKGKSYDDIAILFRTNTQPRMLMGKLMEYNIPFRTKDNVPNLYNHWIARDIFTYIRLAHGSRERADFFQIMNRPKRYISRDSVLSKVIDFGRWKAFYNDKEWIAERIDKLEYDLKMLQMMKPYAAINYIRNGIGYDEFIKEYAQYRKINEDDLFETLEELHQASKEFETYNEWNEYIEEYTKQIKEVSNKKNQVENAITLATLHSSKGLEFDIVFIIDVNEGVMPFKKAVLPQEIEEERRMFYVGMTRAKYDLYLSSVKCFSKNNNDISRFIKETKKKYISKEK